MPGPARLIEKYFEPVIIVGMLAVIIVLVFADVVARFAFQTSIATANEMSRFAFVYMIYFGVSYAIRERRHLRVTLLLDLAPEGLRRVLFAIAEGVFLVYSLAVTWLGVVITMNAVERGQILSSTQWSTATLYAAIVLSGALCVLRLLQSLWRVIVQGDTTLGVTGDV